MRRDFAAELKAIRDLDNRFKDTYIGPARKLARRIAEQKFALPNNQQLAKIATGGGKRSFYSVYSAIRRNRGPRQTVAA